MSAASRQARLNAAILSRAAGFGELVTFTRAGALESTGVQVAAAITHRSDPLWAGGMIGVSEGHCAGYMLESSLATPPAIGDTIITANVSKYEIDQSPVAEHGLWALVLRRKPNA